MEKEKIFSEINDIKDEEAIFIFLFLFKPKENLFIKNIKSVIEKV